MAIFYATGISGLATASYNSGAVNRKFINDLSGSIITNTSNNYYNRTWIDALSGSIDSRLDNLEDNIEFTPINYITSSNAISRFAGSSNYSSHKGDSSIHFTKASIDDDYAGSGSFKSHKDDATIHFTLASIDDDYAGSSNTLSRYNQYVGHSGNSSKHMTTTISSNAKTSYDWFVASSQNLSKAYASTSTGKFEPSLTKGTLTATSPITLSDSTRQLIGGASVISISNYIGSTQAINRFTQSSSAISKFYPSSVGHNLNVAFWGHSGQTNKHIDWTVDQGATNIHTGNYTNTTYTAGTGLDLDGTEFSVDQSEILPTVSSNSKIAHTWYTASSQKLSVAYTHSQDTTQAHTDYLLNSESDTTSGVLTAAGFTTTAGISSNKISSQTIRGITPMSYVISNIILSSQQNINLCRFTLPTNKSAYVYSAYACGSDGIGISGMWVQMREGSTPTTVTTNVYKTSSQIYQTGNPLAKSTAGYSIECRFMYSSNGTGLVGTGYKYGTCGILVGVC